MDSKERSVKSSLQFDDHRNLRTHTFDRVHVYLVEGRPVAPETIACAQQLPPRSGSVVVEIGRALVLDARGTVPDWRVATAGNQAGPPRTTPSSST